MSNSYVPYMRDHLVENDMLFCMLTETWLRDHNDAELHIPNYTIFRSDRVRPKKRRGRNSGGTAIYIRDDLAASSDILLKTFKRCC